MPRPMHREAPIPAERQHRSSVPAHHHHSMPKQARLCEQIQRAASHRCMWRVRCSFRLVAKPHISHLKGLRFECLTACVLRCSRWAAPARQRTQLSSETQGSRLLCIRQQFQLTKCQRSWQASRGRGTDGRSSPGAGRRMAFPRCGSADAGSYVRGSAPCNCSPQPATHQSCQSTCKLEK